MTVLRWEGHPDYDGPHGGLLDTILDWLAKKWKEWRS